MFALALCAYVNLNCIASADLPPHGWVVQISRLTAKPGMPLVLLCDLNTDVNSDFPFEVIFSIHYPRPQKNGQPTNLAALDEVTQEIEKDMSVKNIGICVAYETGLGCRYMVCYMASRESSKNVRLKMPDGFKVSVTSRRDSNWSSWKHYKACVED